MRRRTRLVGWAACLVGGVSLAALACTGEGRLMTDPEAPQLQTIFLDGLCPDWLRELDPTYCAAYDYHMLGLVNHPNQLCRGAGIHMQYLTNSGRVYYAEQNRYFDEPTTGTGVIYVDSTLNGFHIDMTPWFPEFVGITELGIYGTTGSGRIFNSAFSVTLAEEGLHGLGYRGHTYDGTGFTDSLAEQCRGSGFME